jgi:tetratricopeptide (TPR) repeat protein
MKLFSLFLFSVLLTGGVVGALGQGGSSSPSSQAERSSVALAKRLDQAANTPTTREMREAAFAKLMEGQRFAWAASRTRNASRSASAIRAARQAFQAAVEADPHLAEGYTALAELEISQNPGEPQVDEAIDLATLAVRVNKDNFGARRLMARLLSFKARVGSENFDATLAERAATEWREVTRLDPRNSEAWAFLSSIYERQRKSDLRVEALRNWIAGASPIDTQFYRFVMGSRETLSPENASMKLGSALVESGKTREAIEVLSTIVADDPDNVTAIELLRSAVENAEGDAASVAIESLQQAVYANPDNVSLISLLSRIYVRSSRFDEAERLFESAAARLMGSDRASAAQMQAALGDLFVDADQFPKAVLSYERSLKTRGIDSSRPLAEDDRAFAMEVFEKLVRTHKRLNNNREVVSVIDRARRLLGKDDLFADRQLIGFYREEGKRKEALEVVRSVRARYPEDQGFLRLEATLLTETGMVDEAVAAFTKATAPRTGGDGKVIAQDDFSNYLFISNLYTQANRSKEAADAANRAYDVARGNERKQIARLTLATAQNRAGDRKGAEATLREILKQSPDNPIALNNLGYFLLERGELLNEAKDMIQKAVNIDPTNPSYLDSLGWAYFKLGNYSEAEKYLKEAARWDSGSSTIQEHLGDVYAKQNKAELARAAWQRSLRLATDPADIERLRTKLKN